MTVTVRPPKLRTSFAPAGGNRGSRGASLTAWPATMAAMQPAHMLERGFKWLGTQYATLSAVAKAIRGDPSKVNGYAFFKLARRP